MKVLFANNLVKIQASGLDYLRIKTEVAKYVGAAVKTSRGEICFPLSCLDVVKQNIPRIAAELPNECKNDPYEIHAKARLIALDGMHNCATNLLPDYWCDILDIHQQYAVNAMVVPGLLGLCLFDEQGSGKTVMTIAALDILKVSGAIDAAIIVSPKNMLSGWGNDINKFAPNKYQCQILSGDSAKKHKLALSDWNILISNYEGIEAALVTLTALAQNRRFLLIADESYYAKNPDAERSLILSELRKVCAKAYVLCGTPAPNSPYDLINQFNLADMGYSFSIFHKTGNLDNDREAIEHLINSRGAYIRRLKKDIYPNLPEKHFNIIRVSLQGRQRMLYDQAKSDLVMELRSYDNRTFKKHLTSYFQKREALLKICALPTLIEPTFPGTPAKYAVLDDLLQRLFNEKRKVIIWTAYTASIDELVNRYAFFEPLVVDGRVSGNDRGKAVQEFQNNSKRLLFIANPEAGGPGITLHASHDAIYLSYTNKAASHLQSIDRIHRRGQTAHEVNYYYLICENTIEETEISRLRARELQQHDLLGDTYTWPASLDEAIGELTNELPHV